MAKVVSVFNQKGGVGKTTTAVNVSAALAYEGRKVLLFDLDPQANATSGIGLDKKSSRLYEVMVGEESLEAAIESSEIENLDVVKSDHRLAGLEVELARTDGWERVLKERIASVLPSYDLVLFDAPPSLGILSMLSLVASDGILIPIQCEYYALEGVGQLYTTYHLVRQKMNPELQIEGVLLTMYDGRTRLSQQVRSEAESFFREKVFDTVIPRNVRLAEAPSYGRSILEYDAASAGSIAYRKLAREWMERGV